MYVYISIYIHAYLVDQVFMAEAMALSGQLQEARKLYVKCGRVDLAIKLFSDLKRCDHAREMAIVYIHIYIYIYIYTCIYI